MIILYMFDDNKFILFINNTSFTFFIDERTLPRNHRGFWYRNEIPTLKQIGGKEISFHTFFKAIKDWPGFANLDY